MRCRYWHLDIESGCQRIKEPILSPLLYKIHLKADEKPENKNEKPMAFTFLFPYKPKKNTEFKKEISIFPFIQEAA